MDKSKNIEMIRELSNAPGVSGFEDEVVGVIRRRAAGLGAFTEDAMRNLYIRRPGGENLPVLYLDAHSDEVGFIVKAIRPNGMLDFAPLGGWIASNVPAHKVLVRSRDGLYIPGIIASKPPHFMGDAERKLQPEIGDMVIDVGASSSAEILEEFRISIGAPVTPDVAFEFNEKRDLMTGKAFDDRLGCAAIIAVLRELQGENLNVNITGTFPVQEEVGLRGATVTAQVVNPDVAIILEGCPADDTVVESYASQTALKKGPMLRHIDSRMITNPRFQRFALDTAEKQGIPVQEAVRLGGATNGGIVHLSGKAVPTIIIGIPVRYSHSHYGLASYSDFENSVKLACGIIRTMDRDRLASF
jgi:putative aminopeptidase FrvX